MLAGQLRNLFSQVCTWFADQRFEYERYCLDYVFSYFNDIEYRMSGAIGAGDHSYRALCGVLAWAIEDLRRIGRSSGDPGIQAEAIKRLKLCFSCYEKIEAYCRAHPETRLSPNGDLAQKAENYVKNKIWRNICQVQREIEKAMDENPGPRQSVSWKDWFRIHFGSYPADLGPRS